MKSEAIEDVATRRIEKITLDCTLYHGDCLDVLRELPADSVHTVMTSPPYFALRSYLAKDHPLKGQEIGSEPTPEAFIATMVEVFREVRRVLRPDGVCWINLGDSYESGTSAARKPRDETQHGYWTNPDISQRVTAGLQPGNLLNIPHRVAEALRQDGWIWRQTIVWAKRSPMPESVGGWKWVRCRVKVKEGVYNGRRDPHRTDCEFAGNLHHEAKTEWSPCPGCEKMVAAKTEAEERQASEAKRQARDAL